MTPVPGGPRGWLAPVVLALGCGGATPQATTVAEPVVVASAPAGSATSAPAPGPASPRAPRPDDEPDDPEVVAFAHRVAVSCPEFFVRASSSNCQHGDDRERASTLLDHGDRLLKLRTIARLAQRDGDEGQVGEMLLFLHGTEANPDTEPHGPLQPSPPFQRTPACADARTARTLFDTFAVFVARPRVRPRPSHAEAIGQLAGCGDVEALGLVDRVKAMAREHRARIITGTEPWQDSVGIETWAYLGNPDSAPLRAVFFDELAAAQPFVRRAMYEALSNVRSTGAAGVMCAQILARLPAADSEEARSIADHFSSWSESCYAHRDRYLGVLRTHLRERKRFASSEAMSGLRGLCGLVHTPSWQVHGVRIQSGLTPAQRREITDLAAGFADPRNDDVASRVASLEALCVCDRARSRSLVSKAARSSSDEEREMASGEECL